MKGIVTLKHGNPEFMLDFVNHNQWHEQPLAHADDGNIYSLRIINIYFHRQHAQETRQLLI